MRKMIDPKRMGLAQAELTNVDKHKRRALKDTIGVFRDASGYIIHKVCDNATYILSLDNNKAMTETEHLVHKTKDNPNPVYKDFDLIFYKFPSYIRRSAIAAAIGHVSSHETRCEDYYAKREEEISRGHHYKKMEPGFTYTPSVCPTLYKKNIFLMDGNKVRIKVYIRNTWDWIDVEISSRDAKYIKNVIAKGGELLNPHLVFKFNKFYLQFPVQYKSVALMDIPLKDQTVLSVDRGLNHGAVCSVVNAQGRILGRFFSPFKAEEEEIAHIINLIKKFSSLSGTGQSLSSLYTKLDGLKDNYVKQLSRWIVNIAISEGVYGIVLEHLESLKGKGKGKLKSRIHHWTTAKMRDYIKGMAFRDGIRTFIINPKGTSMYAFDGTGKVSRDEKNYSICKFQSGKVYHCDLSASYNIGARYFLRALNKSIPAKEWSELKAKVPELSKRTTWTLNTLRLVSEALLEKSTEKNAA